MIKNTTLKDWESLFPDHVFHHTPERKTVERVILSLVEAYSEDWRAHHNVEHINHMIGTVRLLCSLEKFREVEQEPIFFGVLWHDKVYQTKPQAEGKSNEWLSALSCREDLEMLGVREDIVENSVRLIMGTKDHMPYSADETIMVDADLAILAAPPLLYDQYSQAIREEYSWVPEVDYVQGRLTFLEEFIARDRIFHTDFMRQTSERKALDNLAREIKSLRSLLNHRLI